MSGDLLIRPMRRPELDIAIDWAAGEGWNPGLCDGDPFFSADPEGFFIGEFGGNPVGSISAVAYGDLFGFIGFFVLCPEHRHRGWGVRLGEAAIARLGDRNIGIDGVIERQPDYERSGFICAYRNARYEGVGAPHAGAAEGTIDLREIPFAELSAFDGRFFPAPREKFLRGWISMPNACGAAIVRGGKLAGYGVLRSCRRGRKIGPLFAEDVVCAGRIFDALSARCPGEPIFLDVPVPNDAAVELVRRRGMRPVFETARMYSRGAPDIDLTGVFGVTSFELG